MDSGSYAYLGMAGVWAGPVLVGPPDAFPALVYPVWALSPDLAHANAALVSLSYATSLLRYNNSDNSAGPNGDSHARRHACANAHTHPGAGRGLDVP
jgi:hypothetical protein